MIHSSFIVHAQCLAAAVFTAASGALQDSQAPSGPPPAPVRVAPVTEQEVEDRRMVTGDLRASRLALIASRESGIVIELAVDEGACVSAGDLLARLDDERLRLQLTELQADLAVAAALTEERNADVLRLERDEQMVREAYEDEAAYLKELQDAESATRMARARLLQAERAAAAIEPRIALLNDRLEDSEVRAPFAGTVVAKHTELGEWVGEGDGVVEMIGTDTVEAWINVPQSLFEATVNTAEPIIVRIEAADAEMRTREVRILPMVDPRARSFVVVASIPNDAGLLAPGMSVNAWVPAGPTATRLTVPKSAVMHDDRGEFIYVARTMGPPGGAPAAMPARIEVLFPVEDRYVVRSNDLRPGDSAIIEGNERLFPTAPVTIIEDPRGDDRAAAGSRRLQGDEGERE